MKRPALGAAVGPSRWFITVGFVNTLDDGFCFRRRGGKYTLKNDFVATFFCGHVFFRSCANKEGEEEKRTSEKENRSPLELSTQQAPPYQQQQQQQQQQPPPIISYYKELAYMDPLMEKAGV